MSPNLFIQQFIRKDGLTVRDGLVYYKHGPLRHDHEVEIKLTPPIKVLKPGGSSPSPGGTEFLFDLAPLPDLIWCFLAHDIAGEGRTRVSGSQLIVTSSPTRLQNDYDEAKTLLGNINLVYEKTIPLIQQLAHQVEAERVARTSAIEAKHNAINEAVASLKL